MATDCSGPLKACVDAIINHITGVIHPQIIEAITGPQGVSLIASKLNAFCGNRNVCTEDNIKSGKAKVKAVIQATLGTKGYNGLNNCFLVEKAITDYMRNKLCGTREGNFGGDATGSPVTLCDNIGAWADADWFSDCPAYENSCISPFAGWTVPNNCMNGIYTISKNWVEVRDETLHNEVTYTTFELTEDAEIQIGTVCDSKFIIKFEDLPSLSSTCKGQIFVAVYETVTRGDIWVQEQGDSYIGKISDPAPKKIYLKLLEKYDGPEAKAALLKSLPGRIVGAYTTMVNDFINGALSEEFNKANLNSGLWLSNLKGALGLLAGAGGNTNYTLRQYLTLTIGNSLGGYERHNCAGLSGRALEACQGSRNLCGKRHSETFAPPNGVYWKEVAEANACIKPIMETLDPNCRVISTQYFTANDLENMGRSIDDDFTIADAQNLIKNQNDPYTQCSGVTKIIGITKTDGQLAIQYEFKPSIAWNRGQNVVNYIDENGNTKSCDNGDIASLMGDLVKVLNATRLPSCGLSPLDRLIRTSQDLGRPLKRIGGVDGSFCEYTWPNRTDQNWGNDPNPKDDKKNGPVNCGEYAMPNNCLGYPSIYMQEERFGFIEFLFLISIVLPSLNIKNEADEASELFGDIKKKVQDLIKSILEDVKEINSCKDFSF
jgi:hypothetical protein